MSKRTIDFQCPRCKTKVSAKVQRVGDAIRCPSCKRKLLVPATSTVKTSFDDLFDEEEPDNGSKAKTSDSGELGFADEPSSSAVKTTNNSESSAVSAELEESADLSPISLDGISDIVRSAKSFALKCKVCDSRIYVAPNNIGKEVECPDCYTKILVKEPEGYDDKPKPKKRNTLSPGLAEGLDAASIESLGFEVPEEVETADDRMDDLADPVSVDPSFGLAPVTDDLLAPQEPEEDEDDLSLEPEYDNDELLGVAEDSDLTTLGEELLEDLDDDVDEMVSEKDSAEKKDPRLDMSVDPGLDFGDSLSLEPELELPEQVVHGKTDLFASDDEDLNDDFDDEEIELIDESPEVANQKTAFAPRPKRSKEDVTKAKSKSKSKSKSKTRKKKKRKPDDEDGPPPKRAHAKNQVPGVDHGGAAPIATDADFPAFDKNQWIEPARKMVTGAGLPVWGLGAAALMAVGCGMAHRASMGLAEIDEPTMTENMIGTASWLAFGMIPFWLGCLVLWMICSSIFRQAALGKRHVDGFGIANFSELKDTFFIFAFAFLVSAFPVFIFASSYLTVPYRFFVASILLLGAWYNQSVFQVLSMDVFSNATKIASHWKSYFVAVSILAAIGFVGGLLMELPYFIISWIGAIVGSIIVAGATMFFAAIAGWHCGYVVSSLNAPAED